MLDTAAIAWLTQAHGPLEVLHLCGSTLDVQAMHQLIQGRWPQLVQLILRTTRMRTIEYHRRTVEHRQMA